MTAEGTVTVERVESGHLLRYHPEGGVDYSFAIVVEPSADGAALLKGATGQIPHGGMDILRGQLASLGYRRAAWVRADGRQRELRVC